MGLLTDRVAIVTGAARGIGGAIAEAFGREEAALMLVDRAPAVRDVAARLAGEGVRCEAQQLDVTDVDAVEAMVERTCATLGAIDVLVNNAAVSSNAPVEELSLEEWRRVIEINLPNVFLC